MSPYSNNSSNELTSTPSTTYTYDSNGNTSTKVNTSGTTQYFWDFENRMSSVTLPGSGGTVSFKYDPFGRRIYKSSSSATSVYVYDGDNLIEETNSSGTAVARYSQGPDIDEPLAILRSSATSYFHADGLGSITSLSNSTGTIANTYTYDSFGKLTGSSGSLVNPFQYTARESDSETGLYYYRARYYDPQTGRFITEDPIGFLGGDLNFYAYAASSPTNFVDPLGWIIGVIGDAQDRSDFNHSLQYLKGDPGMRRMIQEMQDSDTLYTVITTHSMSADYTDVSSDDHVIVWNPHLGLKCIQRGGREYGAILTPAMALGHELAHQRHDTVAMFLGLIASIDYTDLEERRVIKNYENPAALTLGEGVRSDHFGDVEWVPTPTSKPQCNCQSPARRGRP